MSIRSPLQLFIGLVCAMMLLLTANVGGDRAAAQIAGGCDSLRIEAVGGNDCCFQLRMSRQSSRIISRVQLTVANSGVFFTRVEGAGGGTTATNDSVRATFNFANGMPTRFDSAFVCLRAPNGTATLVVRWYSGQSVVCTDSLTLRCQTTPPPQGCFELTSDTVKCATNGYTYSFRVRNQSTFNARTLSLRVLSPASGIAVSPSTITFASQVSPGGLSGTNQISITGGLATPGRIITIVGTLCSPMTTRRDSATGRIDTVQYCCTDTFTIRLPECGPTGDCARIDSSSIVCTDNGYRWCFTARNLSNVPFNSVRIISGTNGASQTLAISPALQPGSVRSFCFDIARGNGAGTVSNTLIFCYGTTRDSGRGGNDTMVVQQCCTTKVSVQLPNCPTTGCGKISNVRVECDSATGYIACFTVTNGSSRTMTNWMINAVSPSFTISPMSGSLVPPLAPGSSRNICVRLSGGQLQPGGSAYMNLFLCDSMQRCCNDTFMVQLPRCGQPSNECCSNFRKAFQQLASSASSSGFAALNGFLSAGPQLVKSVSASLVSVTVNSQPAYGYFNFGLLLNTLGVGTVTPGPFGQEVIWAGNGTGVNMSVMTQFFLSMKFPPLATNLNRDTVRYCVKFRYTDVNCVTCDTTLCFTTVRYRFTGNGNIGRKTERKGNDAGSPLGAGGGISGSLTGDNSGTMKIVFPAAPAELGPITYVGLRITSNDNAVQIGSVTAKEPGRSFTVTSGLAMSSFTAMPGDAIDLDISYLNLGGRRSLEHRVALMYTRGTGNDGIFEEEMVVTLNKGGQVTKDSLLSTHAGLTGAYTFAVHLNNANGNKESITRMVITTEEGVRIVAVGPTASDSRATLQFGMLNDGSQRNFVGEIVDGGQVSIAPSNAYGPIYLTLVGQPGEVFNPQVHFVTLNANDQVVSEGDVKLTDPAAGVTIGAGDQGATGAMLRQSFPNPASGSATIQFHLPASERNVTLVVTDVKGREVARLVNGEALTGGEHAVYLDTTTLANGTYYYTLRAGDHVETKSMQIVK